MNEDTFYDFLPVFVLCGMLCVFFILAYRFLKRRKARHAKAYPGDLQTFHKAVIDQDVAAITFYGDRIIWNEFLEQNDKIKIYEAIKPIVKFHPELVQLWKDVHYKTHGYEPTWIETADDEWAASEAFMASQNDIIDQ